jgi:methylenetetrahydrofolate reductase (NADPH)
LENVLRTHLESKTFCYSVELVLGRDHELPAAEAFVEAASQAPGGVDIISVTDLPGGNPALPPEAFASYVVARGLTPIAHLSGKDGNRAFLEGRLHALARDGVESVLALSGDGHRPGTLQPKAVFDLDSVLILDLVEQMRRGIEYSAGARTVKTTPFDFFSGAVVNPYKVREPDQMMQYHKLELKIATGAQFVITQLGFDLRKLYELRQYMVREGMAHIPVIANVYVPTATVAKMIQRGDIAGCVVTDKLVRILEAEKKPQRLERAALMVAAVKDLGFAGAHIGGFGITHKDVMKVIDRSEEIAGDWRGRIEELVFPYAGQFHLLPQGPDGLSNGNGEYQLGAERPRKSMNQRLSGAFHKLTVADGAPARRLLSNGSGKTDAPSTNGVRRHGMRLKLLDLANVYRRSVWDCLMCGDCIQDHLNYPGCTMSLCYKELRNGPCGGSRPDGTCEVYPDRDCVWNAAYENTVAAGDDPRRFARTLMPPRDWSLNRTNSLANRLAGIDGYSHRKSVRVQEDPE